MPPAILGVAQYMNVRVYAKLVNDPDSGLSLSRSSHSSRSLRRHARTRCIPLSHAPRARTTPNYTATSRHRHYHGPCLTRGSRRERDSRRRETTRVGETGQAREIAVTRKGFNESCLLLAQIANVDRENLYPGLSSFFSPPP